MNKQKSLLAKLAETIDQHRAERRIAVQEQTTSRCSSWRRLVRALVPNLGTLIILALFLWAQSAGALPFRAPALAGDSTTIISYQGRLADSSGNPITTPGVAMQFRLYNTDTDGAPLWEETHAAVPVEDGLFHVLLGSTNPIPVSLLASNSALWLGITVGSDSEMTPREQIASVPYAMIASSVPDGSITTVKIADGAVTQAKAPKFILDLAHTNTIVQYGRAIGPTGNDTVVYFPEPFSEPPLVFVTQREMDGIESGQYIVHSVETTKFRIAQRGPCVGDVQWIAIGRR